MKMLQPLVSIVVPCYNASQTIDSCVKSLTEQDYENLEIILLDDGSKDTTYPKLEEWAQKDHRIKILTKENTGVSDTRNVGISMASGEFIQFVDSDDRVDKGYTRKLVDAMLAHNADIAIACAYDVYEDKNPSKYNHVFKNSILTNSHVLIDHMVENRKEADLLHPLWNKIYRKDSILQHNLTFDIKLSYAEDWLFNVFYLSHVDKIVFIDEALYFYSHTTTQSLSKRFRPNGFNDSIYIRKRLAEFFPSSYAGSHLSEKIIGIHRHYLNLYARTNGLRGFIRYIGEIYANPDLTDAFNNLRGGQLAHSTDFHVLC